METPALCLRHIGTAPPAQLDAYLIEPAVAAGPRVFRLRDARSLRCAQVLVGKDDEPGARAILDAPPGRRVQLAMEITRLIEAESSSPPLRALIARCKSQDPFSSQRLEASLSSFIGQDDEDGHLSPEREAIINVLEAYENFWENGPARGATNAKIRKIGAAKLPFPHLTPQAAAQKILEKAAEVQASSQYE